MNEYWEVIERSTGRVIAQCGQESDALMMAFFDFANRTYRQKKFILDQVIDVTSTTDKQLPGQQGLPAAKYPLPPLEEKMNLPQGDQIPINTK